MLASLMSHWCSAAMSSFAILCHFIFVLQIGSRYSNLFPNLRSSLSLARALVRRATFACASIWICLNVRVCLYLRFSKSVVMRVWCVTFVG